MLKQCVLVRTLVHSGRVCCLVNAVNKPNQFLLDSGVMFGLECRSGILVDVEWDACLSRSEP